MEKINFEIVNSLNGIDVSAWNSLNQKHNPFLRFEFLSALENNHCLGENTGWYPNHFLFKNAQDKLIGIVPAYLKTNSFGEFVFDWSWASAYERFGLNYYPKLVLAIPFTPVTGQRLLFQNDVPDLNSIKTTAIKHIISFIENNHISSAHCLFANQPDMEILEQSGWLSRMDYQYHWSNHCYSDFENFLSGFKSRKRKKINRERIRTKQENISFEIKHGNELSEDEWHDAYTFYQSTFLKKGNYAAFNIDFFKQLGEKMGEQVVVVFAHLKNRKIAAAINFRDHNRFYGRYWGSNKEFNSLHFETCFYQGIDYCIKHGLKHFEPGAQGEHKITRGFLPTKTWSAHWISNQQFRVAINDFLLREKDAMKQYAIQLNALSPFKENNLSS